MADISTSMYNFSGGPKPEDVSTAYQQGLTESMNRQAKGLNISSLALQNKQNQQSFDDQQAQRQAMIHNTDENGVLNSGGAVSELAKVNPAMAMALDQSVRKHGLQKTADMNQTMQDFYTHTTPQNYADERQKLIENGHPEAEKLPEVYIPGVMHKGMISTLSADQIMTREQQQRAQMFGLYGKYVEQGIMPPDEVSKAIGMPSGGRAPRNAYEAEASGSVPKIPPEAQSLGPGMAIPSGKKDLEAQKMAQSELSGRQAGDDYKIAKNDLLAANKFNALLEPYQGDYNKFPVEKFPLLASEAAKVSSGGAPTVEQLHSMSPDNIPEKWAKFMSFGTGNPQEMNNGQLIKMYKEYMDDLKLQSMNTLATHYEAAQGVGERAGMSPITLQKLKQGHDKELQGLANEGAQAKKFTPDVVSYAKAHNISPDAAQKIKDQRTGRGK